VTATQRDLAVVIVNYNTAGLLADCLTSLAGGGLAGLSADVWVVDNNSPDDSAERARIAFPAARVMVNATNAGYAAANNLALVDAGFGVGRPNPRYRHALLLNPDTLVPPGALSQLVADADAEADIGIAGPKLVLPDGSLDLACRRSFPTPAVSFYRFSGLARLFPKSRRFGRYNLTFLDPDQPADVDAVVGACMLVRGAAIAAVGLLDEQFWMYGEDLDWALRIHQAGWRVAYRPDVVIQHVKRAASRTSPQARYEFQRAMWLFYRKHYAASTPRAVGLLVAAGLALRGGPALAREMWRAGTTGP
jgi:N-acetylglucosaminyl-diphospho-decaprenol L-rhamnosyltransferase